MPVWKCPECGFAQTVPYSALVESGNPICGECDRDMEQVEGEEALEWDKAHVVFVAKCILQGALDMIESCLPCTDSLVRENPFGPYDKGALESAGEALSIFFAQVSGEGLGCYDALALAGNFAQATEKLVEDSWADGGKAIREAIEAKEGSFCLADIYPNWPNVQKHAEEFATALCDRGNGE
jgi:hypothetical protein